MKKKSIPPGVPSLFASGGFIFFAGVMALIGLFELFRFVDWGQGVLRSFMLVPLGVLIFWLCRAGSRLTLSGEVAKRARFAITTVAVFAACFCLMTVTESIRRTTAGGEILLDQGQNSYRALRLLEQGINPYGRQTMLDPVEYASVQNRIRQSSPCLVSPVGDYRAELFHYWQTLDVKRATEKVFLVIKNDPACEKWTIPAQSLGYKYGPVLLASYWPFVKIWDKAGIYVNHLIVLSLFVSCLLIFSYRRYDRKAGIFLLPVIMLLVPSPVRQNVLYLSASDLLPTASAVLAALFFLEKRFTAGAIFLALSIGAKPLPGLLYLPLMSGARPRDWVLLAGIGLVFYAPVFMWDFQGAMNNLVLFNILRSTDSTALLHYLPSALQTLWPLVALGGIIALAVRGHNRKWLPGATFEYLIGAHLLLFASGKIFHNNYLVWILPLAGLALAESHSRVIVSNDKRK